MVTTPAALGWEVYHKNHDGSTIAIFKPENLEFVKNLNAPHDINYETSLRDPNMEHDFVGPYRTDWQLRHNGVIIPEMAGMHVDADVETDSEHTPVAGKSWLHYLERRHWPFDPTNPVNYLQQGKGLWITGTDDLTDIVEGMLDGLLDDPDCLDFTHSGNLPTGFTKLYHMDIGDEEDILSKIQDLADTANEDAYDRVTGGFDFGMTINKNFYIESPEIDPDQIPRATFDKDSDNYEKITFGNRGPIGTHLMGTGAATGFVINRIYRGGAQVYRRLDFTRTWQTITSNAALRKAVIAELMYGVNPIHEIIIHGVQANQWTDFFTRFIPGHYVFIDKDLISHRIDSTQKITSIDYHVTNEGTCTADFHLTQLYSNPIPADFGQNVP